MADLTDQLRERAERAERELELTREARDKAIDVLVSLEGTLSRIIDNERALARTAREQRDAAIAQRDEARAQRDSWRETAERLDGQERAERDEARDALRDLVSALMLDDAPRLRAIEAARALAASWGAQTPGPLCVGMRVGETMPQAIARLVSERDARAEERDTLRAELDAVREALETVREDGETCAAAVARLLAESDAAHALVMRHGAEVAAARAAARRGALEAAARVCERRSREWLAAPIVGNLQRWSAADADACATLIRALAPEAAPEQPAPTRQRDDGRVVIAVETIEACVSCEETFTAEEQRSFDPNNNDHCPKCGRRLCLTTYYGLPEYRITESMLDALFVDDDARTEAALEQPTETPADVHPSVLAHLPSPSRVTAEARMREACVRPQQPAEVPAERPIAVGDRVRVVRCCESACRHGRRAGLTGELLRVQDRESVPGAGCYWIDCGAPYGKMVVAAVERVEPTREEPAHAIGDTWEHEDGMSASVEATHTGGRLEFRGFVGVHTPGELRSFGWRRVRCAGEPAREEPALPATCGECGHFARNVSSHRRCRLRDFVPAYGDMAPPPACPLRKREEPAHAVGDVWDDGRGMRWHVTLIGRGVLVEWTPESVVLGHDQGQSLRSDVPTVTNLHGWRRVRCAEEPAREEPAHAVGDVWRHDDGREARVRVVSTGLCGCLTLSLRVPGDRGPAAGCGTPETLEREGWRRVRCAGEVDRG